MGLGPPIRNGGAKPHPTANSNGHTSQGLNMEFLGLHYAIWIILAIYFAGMLLMGWWSKRGIHNQEGYLLGNR